MFTLNSGWCSINLGWGSVWQQFLKNCFALHAASTQFAHPVRLAIDGTDSTDTTDATNETLRAYVFNYRLDDETIATDSEILYDIDILVTTRIGFS